MAERKNRSRTYEENRSCAEKYFAKCERIQMFLNPDNDDDKTIMEYLSANTDGISRQKQIKQMLLKYIKLSETFKGI